MALYPTPKFCVGDLVSVHIGAWCGDDIDVKGRVTAYYLGEDKDFPTDPYSYRVDTLPGLCRESTIKEVQQSLAEVA